MSVVWLESPRKFSFRRKSLKSCVHLSFDIFYQEFCWEVLFQIFFHDLRSSERLHVFVSQKDNKMRNSCSEMEKRYRVKKVLQKMILLGYPTSIREQTKRTPKRVLKKAIVKVVFSSCFWFSCSWRLADSWCSERTPGTSLAVSVPDFMHLIKVLKIFSLLVVFYYQASRPPSHHPLVETWGNQLNFSLCFRPFSVLLKWDNF